MSNCECSFCKNEKEFVFPRELLDRISEGKVAIFAGAGISTENRDHCRGTFYDQIQVEIGASGDLDFPSLMSLYCSRPDGRIKLVQKIRDRLNYFSSFRGFYVPMTRFHRAIRPLFMIKDVITTNWDDFFEAEAGLEPFVYDQDLALVDSSKRRVIKIHGSITNYGSIVATSEDYAHSLKKLRNGAIGAYLKNIIASKTIIYTGYSLKDPNYLKLVQSMTKIMGPFVRSSYYVSPYIDHEYLRKTGLNLIPVETDGSFFLEQFRTHYNSLAGADKIIPEAAFDTCAEFLIGVNSYHSFTADKFLETKNKLLILALSYQDGLQDALMRIKDTRASGEYYNFDHVHALIHGYENKVNEYVSADNLWDACYCRGYQNGLLFLLSNGDAAPPIVDLIFDETIDSAPKVLRFPRKKIPKTILDEIDKLFSRIGQGDLIPEHMPYV
ncbi:SIR2 family protein [Mesorhizobium sp. YC-39]|uniref:SIR2 family protein n=1 Tax=unclassified Mesorhizobium TaxID=325217 RepID=UPI0021E878F0|nr:MULTISPECIES: SIR2 family protein [unclassified Mesorhizobium]MCV3209740.1 SIR2 family protein [Mesorhizobium sp. YC-2]MCV3230270.1 SIR2 family protein [Mesorhizobium sp. YC-39]